MNGQGYNGQEIIVSYDEYDIMSGYWRQLFLQLDNTTVKKIDVNREVITISIYSSSIGTIHPLGCNANLTAN